MNFIWIGSHALENQTSLFLLLESEFFGQNIDSEHYPKIGTTYTHSYILLVATLTE